MVLVIDLQPNFLEGIWEADRVLQRSAFLIKVANVLGVPVLASEQYATRMGGTSATISEHLQVRPFDKMTFSCAGCSDWSEALSLLQRDQVVLVGIETHICVTLSALDLLASHQVAVCPDAVSARTADRHKLGMERMRDCGVMPVHTEALAYDWMQTAEHERFREVLSLVKEHSTW